MDSTDTLVEVDSTDAEIVARVAAIDVAKDSGMVCARVPHQTQLGRRTTAWSVSARTNSIIALADQLAEQDIERVVLEATSDYWRPFYYLLEACGLTVWLVNARDVKNVPGRPKTDKLDAVWLAKLNERGMLRPSFVPPVEIRQLRDYTRLRVDLTAERSRHIQRLEKLLEDALIKLSSVVTDMMGVSGRAMIAALIAGERDPRVLADLAKGRLRVKHTALIEALTGRFDEHHAELAAILLDQADNLSAQIERLDNRMEQMIADIPAAQAPADTRAGDGVTAPAYLAAVDRLDEVTGIGRHAAQVIIAEVGLSMATFPTSAHLVSWAKISPRTIQSGAKNRAGKTGKGNRYLKGVLGEAAAAAARTNTFLGARYRRLARRISKLQALVAVARSILVIVWHLLADPTSRYHDLGPEFFDNRIRPERRKINHIRQLEALGFHRHPHPSRLTTSRQLSNFPIRSSGARVIELRRAGLFPYEISARLPGEGTPLN